MSYTPTRYPQGTFSWADFFSTDVAQSKAFLIKLFGWSYEDMPTGEGKPDYTMFSLDGKYTAGGSQGFEGMPSFWSSYITVANVDEMTQKAKDLGASVKMEPMDIFDSGRMAVLEDTVGASVSLWQPKNHIGAGIINTVGAMCWNEHYTPDIEKSKKFYEDLLGWTYETDDTGYVTIFNNGRRNGGMMQISGEMQGMIPCWIVYFTVQNMSDAVNTVKELGGQIHMQRDIEVGKIAMISDPAAAHFMILEMNVTPDEWSE